MGRGWWIAAGLAVAAGGGALWYETRPVVVSVDKVKSGPAADLVYATGYVEAQQPVSVSSRITAPVDKVLVNEGDHVRKGQALAILFSDEQRALVDQAGAQQRSAEVIERRSNTLFKEGWVTAAARDNATTAAAAARAASATARARLDQLVVRANIDGIVTKRDVYPGDMALPTKVLFQLGDPARTRITATVDERDIARVKVGQAALMASDAWAGRVIHGVVAEVTPAGDPTSRAFRVRLLAKDAPDLPLGLTLEVNIVTSERKAALLVPASAVVSAKDSNGKDIKDQARVYVVSEGRAHLRPIAKGTNGAAEVEVTGGLKAGEVVVVNPPATLADGTRITINTSAQ